MNRPHIHLQTALVACALALTAAATLPHHSIHSVEREAIPIGVLEAAPLPPAQLDLATDLGNGFYPQLRQVGAEDPEFKAVLAWLGSNGAPPITKIEAQKAACISSMPCTPKPGGYMPAEVWFHDSKHGDLSLDAVLVYNFPHVALIDLENFYAFGDPKVLKWFNAPREPVKTISLAPVGEPWPDQCAKCFRAADTDSLEIGSRYEDTRGVFRKVRFWWAFFPQARWELT